MLFCLFLFLCFFFFFFGMSLVASINPNKKLAMLLMVQTFPCLLRGMINNTFVDLISWTCHVKLYTKLKGVIYCASHTKTCFLLQNKANYMGQDELGQLWALNGPEF